ncbi:MAG: cyclic pyranopterin phosphate synthase MoaA [Myxococcales bacterium]|nr:cyclic pyranopterin phosphate synthase MoaA [Myxococcales bacterium]
MYQQFKNPNSSQLFQIGQRRTKPSTGDVLDTYTLRISVLEQCHYRCPYCMPGATKAFMPKSKWLDAAGHSLLAQGFNWLPIEKIRFTGGEPLLRQDLPDILAAWHEALPEAALALTTNGDKLKGREAALQAAGLTQLTFHLDTLRPERYGALMGPGSLKEVLNSLETAKGYFLTIKINMVLQKGLNDDEVFDFLRFAKKHDVQVRFIELMDTGSAPAHVQKTFLSQQDLLKRIEKDQPVTALGRANPADPAAIFELPNTGFSFGMIASDTEPFCEDCNRLRLSADGMLRGCLYEPQGVPLKAMLDKKLPITDLKDKIRSVVMQKSSFHPAVGRQRVPFSMAQVGG